MQHLNYHKPKCIAIDISYLIISMIIKNPDILMKNNHNVIIELQKPTIRNMIKSVIMQMFTSTSKSYICGLQKLHYVHIAASEF